MLCAKFTVSRNFFANFDPRKIREYEHNRLQVNVLKYIFFLESLASMKMFDTELQVYINRCFVFLLKLATQTCLSYKGDVVLTVFFIYCKICICLIPNSFHIYCANFFLPLWFILAWRSFICLRTAFDITSRVLLSMTNATQWILSAWLECLTYPVVSDSKGTKGINYNIKYI